jgi:hypothetical protein
MQEKQWEVLEHPSYSPDLAPSDFHLFGPLKHHLSAEHFSDDEAVEKKVTACETMGQVPQCTGRLC